MAEASQFIIEKQNKHEVQGRFIFPMIKSLDFFPMTFSFFSIEDVQISWDYDQ